MTDTPRSQFDAFVKQQTDDAVGQSVEFDSKKELAKWLDNLESLYTEIQDYLRPYIDGGTVKVATGTIDLNEDFVGDYEAPKLLISIGRKELSLIPVGTMLIGSRGRVDVKGPNGFTRLVLVNKNWKTMGDGIRVTVTTVPASGTLKPVVKAKVDAPIEWAWRIASRPPQISLIPLNADTCFQMLLEVADG